MTALRSVAEWMTERSLSIDQLVELAGVEKRVVKAIVQGHYTASPEQRKRLAEALGTTPDQMSWGHSSHVEHVYGHGPQFGRSP